MAHLVVFTEVVVVLQPDRFRRLLQAHFAQQPPRCTDGSS